MGHKRKREHFAEIRSFGNVLEVGYLEVLNKSHAHRGKWRENVFHNQGPVVLELGCGKGEYTLALSDLNPEANCIGMDIKGARIWRGAKTATVQNRSNVYFLRCRIEFVESLFGPNEVDEIWITFPDPQMQTTRSRKRLTSPSFLKRYFTFLKPGGIIHLKTDSDFLYQYTLDVLKNENLQILIQSRDLYGELAELNLNEAERELLEVRTHYEKMFTEQGHTIHYLRFTRSL